MVSPSSGVDQLSNASSQYTLSASNPVTQQLHVQVFFLAGPVGDGFTYADVLENANRYCSCFERI
jgi:hypothetical protein